MRTLLLAALLALASVPALAQNEQVITGLYTQINQELAKQHYQRAAQLAEQALGIARKNYGKADTRLLNCMEKLYDVHIAGGNRHAAELDRKRILDCIVSIYGPSNTLVLEEKLRLANFYAIDERWKECNLLYEDVIPALERQLRRVQAVSSMREYAVLLRIQSRGADAERWEQRAQALERDIAR